jgi:hypothetical protein
MSIPAGTTLDFRVNGVTTTSWLTPFTPAELQGDAANELARHFPFVDIVLEAGSDYIIGGLLPYSYVATVRITTRYAHAQAMDAGSFIRAAFAKAAGSAPSVALVTGGTGATLPGSSSAGGSPNPLDRPGDTPSIFDLFALPSVPVTTTIVVAVVGLAFILVWKT